MYRRTILASIGTVVSTIGLAGCTGLPPSADSSSEDVVTLDRVTVENKAPSKRRISIDVVYDASVEYTRVETIPAGESLTVTDEWPNEEGQFVVLCYSDTDDNYHLTTLDTTQARESNSGIVGYEIKFEISDTGDVTGNVQSFNAD